MDKYAYGISSKFNIPTEDGTFQFGIVEAIGKVGLNTEDGSKRKADERFNSDPDIIRCRILGSDWDKKNKTEDLPNCYPILPKHINVVPKKGEMVFIFLAKKDNKFLDRYYIGPLISSPANLKLDTEDGTALASLSISPISPNIDVDTIPDAKGVFPKPNDVSIQGRDNSDIIFKDNEVLLRAGQHELNKPLIFNKKNPGYLQIKYQSVNKEGDNKTDYKSVVNLVGSKINLITHEKGKPRFNLSNNEDYISNDELVKILKEAHPLAFGDVLLDYLKKLELAFTNHVHRFPGLKASALRGENYLKDYIEYPTETILSDNIKIN